MGSGGSTLSSPPLLDISPRHNVALGTPSKTTQVYRLHLTNKDSVRLGWAVHSTCRRFSFEPRCGVLDAGESAAPELVCTPLDSHEADDDRVTIEWARAPDGATRAFHAEWLCDKQRACRKHLPVVWTLREPARAFFDMDAGVSIEPLRGELTGAEQHFAHTLTNSSQHRVAMELLALPPSKMRASHNLLVIEPHTQVQLKVRVLACELQPMKIVARYLPVVKSMDRDALSDLFRRKPIVIRSTIRYRPRPIQEQLAARVFHNLPVEEEQQADFARFSEKAGIRLEKGGKEISYNEFSVLIAAFSEDVEEAYVHQYELDKPKTK